MDTWQSLAISEKHEYPKSKDTIGLKILSYAYPSSTYAVKHNNGKACYIVGFKKTVTSYEAATLGFETFEEAKREGDKLPQPWDKYSYKYDLLKGGL